MQTSLSKKHACSQRPGFTIIEILVVLVILGLILAGMYPNLQRQLLRTRLHSNAAEIQAELRNTRTWATAVRDGVDLPDEDFNTQLVAYAARLEVGNPAYTLWEVWADEEGDWATFEQTPSARKYNRTITHQVAITDISPAQAAVGKVDLYFETPFGYLSSDATTLDTEKKVTLTLTLRQMQTQLVVWENGNIAHVK